MGDRNFKYRREDFGELPVVLHHLTIELNFMDNRVEAMNRLDMTARTDLDELVLDADSLEIRSVEWCAGASPSSQSDPLDHEYDLSRNRLTVRLPRTVKEGESFSIRTTTSCIPSDHILEGIYKDVTPPGAPQQYMSQCQQWGFQRIMPIFDDCRAKCSMTTTIEADAAYTHLISNGNVCRKSNPDGRPIPKPGTPGRQIVTYENPIPMAPYLFLVCVGTWDALVDEVTYPSGRTVRLEYLVPKGRVEDARIPMEILKESILWIRSAQDYEYTGETYRTICMTKSNFGGMENVGNTTIVTDAALIDEYTVDQSMLYAHAVIVHEFEHNQCGSETTMETPFDVWLNEAYTVDVERQFMAHVFDPVFVRLNQVESIRNPLLGPLALEDGGHVGRIVREGFNNPDELIDGVTYVKAADVIRMLRLILGEETFHAAKTLYFSRYHNGNADTDQFFACFEETAGISLDQFKQMWLYTIGYPKVTADTRYDAATGEFRITLKQESPTGAPFHLPVEAALVDAEGKDLPGTRKVLQLKDESAEFVFQNIATPPAFASLNRDYSFYGTFRNLSATPETLALQTRLDPNLYNRVDAMRQLTDRERVKLLQHLDAPVDPAWISLYGEILADSSLSSSLKAYFLRIDEQPLDRDYSTWYVEQVHARERLMDEVNRLHRSALLEAYYGLDDLNPASGRSMGAAIGDRLLKQVILDLIVSEDSPESHEIIQNQYRRATTANDRVAALAALNRSSSPIRRDTLEEVYRTWSGHLSGYANYLRIIAGGTNDDVFDMIEQEKNRPTFDITHPTWNRALFLSMAVNNKMVWTDRGIRWVAETVKEISPINTTTASRLLNTFQHVKRLKPVLREKVQAALESVVASIPESVNPTVHGQVLAYLR